MITGEFAFLPSAARRDAYHDYHNVFIKLVNRLRKLTGAEPESWQVLDMGTGYNYPNVVLMQSIGASATGVDVKTALWRDGVLALYRSQQSLEHRNPIRAASSALVRWTYYALYFKELNKLAGVRLDHSNVNLITYDGKTTPLPPNSFTCIISNAVLEHVMNLDIFVEEVNRLLVPGGVVQQ